ncbi:MAG: NADH-quinone oxidoreductase subunit L, partial [Planctomycetota bacterium]|nr:NADH-quinone oxidoreductase subunit L [Planctomycetota bacterium]
PRNLFLLRHRPFFEPTLCLIPLLPVAGFLLNGLFGRRLGRRTVNAVAVLASLAALVWAGLCVGALSNSIAPGAESRDSLHVTYGTWLRAGDFSAAFGLYLDSLAAVMILVVTGVGMLIHLYSVGYMARDDGVARFFAYMNLFLAAMSLLVLGDNLLVLFVGWEGVGLCSYLLIGFWYENDKNTAAGMKAFIVTRIGDLGFLLGIMTLFAIFGTVSLVAKPERAGGGKVTRQTRVLPARTTKSTGFVELPRNAGLLDYADAIRMLSNERPSECTLRVGEKVSPQLSNLDLSRTLATKVFPGRTLTAALTLACVLLFIGAIGKSAQIPLYVWLPDAMAGPTPVSALIHAATMVTAGVYMVSRLHGLYVVGGGALYLVAIVGGATALFSALIGLTQLDIKKVLAYSTVSQLGYLFLALGVGAFSLGVFHLVTHAFFKALLFLGAGSVIHALSGEQDLRRMGGLRRKLPITFWTMVLAAAALSGVPWFSGWYSKDAILLSVLARYYESREVIFLVLYICAVAAAFCTAFYVFRIIGLTFFGESRSSEEAKAHVHESPRVMTGPLLVLALFSVIAGMLWHGRFEPETGQMAIGLRNVSAESTARLQHVNFWLTFLAAALGILLAWLRYCRARCVPNPDAAAGRLLYRLSLNKFYVDEIYQVLLVTPFMVGAELLHWLVEMLFIDLLVTGTGYAVAWLAGFLRRMQTGLVNSYAAAILVGALALLFYLLH